jgi:hypothetical protein
MGTEISRDGRGPLSASEKIALDQQAANARTGGRPQTWDDHLAEVRASKPKPAGRRSDS